MCDRHGGAISPRCQALIARIEPTKTTTRPRRGRTVGEHVAFQPTDGVGGMLSGGGEHVMPLENLVEHDPIQEPAEPNAEKEAR